MGNNEYSSHRRLGCSVCSKRNTTLINNSSKNLRLEKKYLEKNVTTNLKYNKCEKSNIISTLKLKDNECYCHHMENIKKEALPKLICSKRIKTPYIDIDKDWLNDILEFRRENWFDCHSDTTILKKVNRIYNINVNTQFNHSTLNHTENNVSSCMCMNSSTIREKKTLIKPTNQKMTSNIPFK